jgi:D-arabinose 1-dehydrogenase-like Zn-dependent alcohol dehydrogenase
MALVRPEVTRAIVFHAPDDLRLEEVPLPPLADGEMLVRITACGLCPGEVMDWYMARKAPVPLGHEPVGEVVEVSPGVAFRPGDRVFVHHHAPCLVCRACRRGDHVHCATWRPRRLIPGGLATYAVAAAPAPTSDALPLPKSLSDEDATFIEPVACVLKSVRRAHIRPGDRVLVIGLGVMGLLHLLVFRQTDGPSLLIGADRMPERVAFARAHRAADVVLDTSEIPLAEAVAEATHGEGADVVVTDIQRGPGAIRPADRQAVVQAEGQAGQDFQEAPDRLVHRGSHDGVLHVVFRAEARRRKRADAGGPAAVAAPADVCQFGRRKRLDLAVRRIGVGVRVVQVGNQRVHADFVESASLDVDHASGIIEQDGAVIGMA